MKIKNILSSFKAALLSENSDKISSKKAHSIRGKIAVLKLKIGSHPNLSTSDKQELIECVNSIRDLVDDNNTKVFSSNAEKIAPLKESNKFISEIKISEGSDIIIVDDDIVIHEAWKIKLKKSGLQFKEIHSFFNPEDFNKWITENGHGAYGSRYYFFDYDLKNDNFSGLDLIERHGLAFESVLISGLAGDVEIHERTKRLDVLCLRKDFLSEVPIVAVSLA
jgi:hypothetical protein